MTGALLGALIFLTWGVVSYTGAWKGWIGVRRGYGATIGFASLWLGLAFALGTVALAVESFWRPAFFVLSGVAAILLVIAIVGFFWLPRFLLPKWFRALRGDDVLSKETRMKFFTGRAAPEPAIAVAETTHANVTYPNWLEVSGFEGADLVLTPVERAEGFTPNLVLTSVASAAPLMDASAAAFDAARAQHPGAYVLAVDMWHLPSDESAPRGRRIIFVYRGDGGEDVLVAKWVWATGTHHVHLSASCFPSQWTGYSPMFDGVAAHLALTAPAEDIVAAAASLGEAPLDAGLTDRTGYPVEALESIGAPIFVSTAPRGSTAALQALLTGATKSQMGAAYGILARTDRGSATARELRDVGWIEADGQLTRDGAAVGMALASNRHVVTVKARSGDRASVLIAYAGPRGVLVLHDAALSETDITPSQDGSVRHAALIAAEHVPTFVSAWLGLTPGWPVSDIDETVSAEDLEAHFAPADPTVEPWTEVLIRGEGGDLYDAVSPSRGWLHVGAPVDGVHPLRAEPTAVVLGRLVLACEQALV